jgi:hypothetical protein
MKLLASRFVSPFLRLSAAFAACLAKLAADTILAALHEDRKLQPPADANPASPAEPPSKTTQVRS